MYDMLVCWGLLTLYAVAAGYVSLFTRKERSADEALIRDIERECDELEANARMLCK